MSSYSRVLFVQPTVPAYRKSFFKNLHEALGQSLVVYSSQLDMGALSQEYDPYKWQRMLQGYKKIGPIEWQLGVSQISLSKNDLIVLSAAPRTLSNLFLLIKARILGAKIVWWGHYKSSTSSFLGTKIRMFLMRFPHALLFYTDEEVAHFKKSFPKNTKPIFALNNGLDTKEIVKYRKPYDPIKRKTDLLFIGRVTEKANLLLLISALSNKMLKNVTLSVIGDGSLKDACKKHAHELDIEDRITWYNGTADEAEISKIANQCKIFVYPGGVGLSLIHGLAYGLPVLVHDSRWHHMPEIAAFENGTNGLSFEYDNTQSLVQVLSRLVQNNKALTKMSKVAIATIAHDYNTDAMATRFMNMITDLEKPI